MNIRKPSLSIVFVVGTCPDGLLTYAQAGPVCAIMFRSTSSVAVEKLVFAAETLEINRKSIMGSFFPKP